jgi:SET domain-containing protein
MNYRTEPMTMWVDRRLVMGKSPIHGTGTFATEDIYAGETLIWVTGGLVFIPQDWEAGTFQLDPELYTEAALSDNCTLVTPKSFHYYINHSCDPNAVDQSHRPTWTHYIALRDIQAWEEITADYYVYGEGKLEHCACQSPSCRWRQHQL